MPKVRISATRFHSLLANRNLTPADVAARVKTRARPDLLASQDQDVELEDILILAKMLKRPWSYLLIDDAEIYPDAGSDNRTYANQKAAPSPGLLQALQSADAILDAAADLFPEETFTVPDLAGDDVPVSRLAADIRALLGISIAAQLASKDQYGALRQWVAAIHGRGVYVSQQQLKEPTVRAFSKTLGNQAIIVVDTGDTPYARIFSALHEYCHVTLRSTGICDLDDRRKIERYCNAAAAEVLIPGSLIDETVSPDTFAGSDDEVDGSLKALSRRLHVSQAAILIRLRDYGTISQQAYEAMELRRAARRGGEGKRGGTYYPPVINRSGRLFAHQVVGAMNDGVIGRQDASVLLGVGEHTIPRYVTELAKGD